MSGTNYIEDVGGTDYPISAIKFDDLDGVYGVVGRSSIVQAASEEEVGFLISLPDVSGVYGPFEYHTPLVIDEYQHGAEVGSVTIKLGVGVSDQPGSVGDSISYPQYSTQSGGVFTVSDYGAAIITGEFDAIPCFAAGTLIATAAGEVAVENLQPCDLVTLASGDTARVTWIGHRRQHDGDVIRICRHAIAPHVPTRDLIVSADHGIYLDGVLVQAGLLVNGETILREHRAVVTFWHVELERHAILLADGASAESYLDTGNRRQFSNCDLLYDPQYLSANPCVEMVFDGERLDQIRARLPVFD